MSTKLDIAKYILHGRPYRLEKPVVLQFPVIDICNSRCQMCKIWENKKSNDITPQQLRAGLDNTLFSEVRAVGLNGGEPTLRKDLAELVEVLFEKLPSLKHISLITNAYKTAEVIERIDQVGRVVQAHGGHLDVMVSLDGYGEMHDRVRGKPGNFERARKVLDHARAAPNVGSVRVGCTVIKENVFGLEDLLDFCIAEDIYVKYRIGIPHQRLYTADVVDPYDLDVEERYHFAEFINGLIAHYEPNESQKFFYKSLVGQLTEGKPRAAGCDWQHRGATITSRGELLYCAVKSKSLGQIDRDDANALYFGNEPHLKEIIAKDCDTCRHDYVGLPDRGELVRQTAVKLLDKTSTTDLARRAFEGTGVQARRQAAAFAARLKSLRGLASKAGPPRRHGANRQVMIAGWYGTETLGDKAILAGVAAALRKALGPFDATLVSLHPYVSRMTLRQMPELDGWTICTPEEAMERLPQMDILVFGGGPIMGLQELADIEAMFERARASGVSTVLAGCGVGPTGLPHQRASIARILDLADLRIFRDDASKARAGALGTARPTDAVAEDPAFTWLSKVDREIEASRPAGGKVLLLGLRDFPWHEYARHLPKAKSLEIKQTYESVVVEALAELCRTDPELTIRPLPMCTNHFGGDDRWFYRNLFRRAAFADRIDRSLLGRELAPVEYAQAFKNADLALTMRFHSVVFSLGLGVPSVVIDYTLGQGKVSAIAERFDLPVFDLATLRRDDLVAALRSGLAGGARKTGFEPRFTEAMVRGLTAAPAEGRT